MQWGDLMIRDDRFVATREQAARIADISTRQVDYWTAHGLVEPTVDARLTPGRVIRMFDFGELMALCVASQLRVRGVSLQHIRSITTRVKESDGYAQPLTELRWATENGRLYFQHPDGGWEGSERPRQVVIHEVLDLEELRIRIRDSARRDAQDVGRIERRRGTKGSKEVVAGTRVPVATVRRYLSAGRSPEEVVASFPALEVADVEAIAAVGV